ncbi:Sulfur carrier protein FdhD [Frankliniella fusca]|uniref:Sulfur carrier protein FdhD n=1 Tax=Frankliniella fusca TaxID=407009 RepID=A0AAE1H9Y1_9NEOP|nr:Sulfur carrier protein FdhD [Frankliniella fusca]
MRLDATRSDLTSPVACPNESSELSQEVLASVARKGGKNRPTAQHTAVLSGRYQRLPTRPSFSTAMKVLPIYVLRGCEEADGRPALPIPCIFTRTSPSTPSAVAVQPGVRATPSGCPPRQARGSRGVKYSLRDRSRKIEYKCPGDDENEDSSDNSSDNFTCNSEANSESEEDSEEEQADVLIQASKELDNEEENCVSKEKSIESESVTKQASNSGETNEASTSTGCSGIKVQKLDKNRLVQGRDWSKKYACIYCSKLVCKTVEHISSCHKDEPAVMAILAMPVNSTERVLGSQPAERTGGVSPRAAVERHGTGVEGGATEGEPNRRDPIGGGWKRADQGALTREELRKQREEELRIQRKERDKGYKMARRYVTADQLPHFKGDEGESFSEFIDEFESYAAARGLNDEEKMGDLGLALKGEAKTMLNFFRKNEPHATPDKIILKLGDVYVVHKDVDEIRNTLYRMERKKNEHIRKFMARMMRAVSDAEGRLSQQEINTIMKGRLVRLLPPSIFYMVKDNLAAMSPPAVISTAEKLIANSPDEEECRKHL